MKYMGSKARIKKEILPIILKDRKENQYFVDLFAFGKKKLKVHYLQTEKLEVQK